MSPLALALTLSLLGPLPGTLGTSLPDYAARDLTRAPVALRSLAGQPLLVNLWATWCQPCMHELPRLTQVHDAYATRGLKIVAISIDDQPEAAKMVAGDLQLPYLVLNDPLNRASETFGVVTIPATFLYDAKGTLVWRFSGLVDPRDARFVAALERALGPTAPGAGPSTPGPTSPASSAP